MFGNIVDLLGEELIQNGQVFFDDLFVACHQTRIVFERNDGQQFTRPTVADGRVVFVRRHVGIHVRILGDNPAW